VNERDNALVQKMVSDVHKAMDDTFAEARAPGASGNDDGVPGVIDAMEVVGCRSFIAGYRAAGGTWPDVDIEPIEPNGLTIVKND
jgi:hypothetical protein